MQCTSMSMMCSSFVTSSEGRNLFFVAKMAERFGTRPSTLLGIADESIAFALDAAALEHLVLVELKQTQEIAERFENN